MEFESPESSVQSQKLDWICECIDDCWLRQFERIQ